ncbi:MAG: superoxide dismutase, Ni [Parcubacteria group bacterium Gr01-1014_33]|nr:MAG: superoxide dismutase, Ni [Parcubacteria group bacterium Gr01-1014_33]
MGNSKTYRGKINNVFSRLLPVVTADAHCDIPCGIYDAIPAKIAAMTVLRMVLQIHELKSPDTADAAATVAFGNSMSRRCMVKEQHAAVCKEELLILWTDFFKPEHTEKYPNLHDTFWKAAKLCSKNKQEVNDDAARQLVAAVDEIAKIFYEVKGAPERYEAYKTITDKLF